MLDSSDHMLCLGSTPVFQHSSASPSSALRCWCEKNPEIEARSLSLGFQLPQPSSIATVAPSGFQKDLPGEQPFQKEHLCVFVFFCVCVSQLLTHFRYSVKL